MIYQRCTCCKGKGEIQNGGPNGWQDGRGVQIIECPVCGGSGEEEVVGA